MFFLVGFTMFLWVFLKLWAGYSLVMVAIHIFRDGYNPSVLQVAWWVFLALFLFKGAFKLNQD